jgi:CrcB protein
MTAGLLLVGAALGALARYETGRWIHRLVDTTRPVGTAVVNVTGAFCLGLVAGLAGEGPLGDGVVDVVGVGLLGGYTTFSTWMVESVELADGAGSGGAAAGVGNVILPLVAGVAAAAAGLTVGRLG